MRRSLSRSLAAVAAGLLLAAGAYFASRRARPPSDPLAEWRRLAADAGIERPDVVLVTIDTLRADRLSCYGSTRVETPNLDALATEGVRFADAASAAPFTLPAHSSIMTGTYPPRHGLRENVGYALGEELPTLAEGLRAAGYATAAFVSAFVLDARWGIARGFDHYRDDFDLGTMERANMGSVQRDGRETIAAAFDWLDGRPSAPFFLWIHLFDPHDPYTPPEPWASRYAGRPYDGEVAYADSLIGELRRGLEERGLLERVLLVVVGDHGEGLGSHGEGFHGFYVYESTVHVPLVVRAPFGDFAGRVVRDAVSQVDLLPTILEAVGSAPAPEAQGKSLLPLVLGRSPGEERLAYSESLYPLLHYGWAPLRALRRGSLKYIDAPRPERYDLASDPEERRNLASERAALAAELKSRLDILVAAMERDAAVASPAELDEEALAQLRALGYVAGRGEAATADERDAPRADPKDRIGLHQLIMQAQSDIGQGDEAAAEAKLEGVLAQDPTILDAHQMLGSIAGEGERHAEAVGHFRRALELDPDHKASLFGLARAYRELGRLDDALVGFRRLLELAPGDSKAALAAADIHVARNQLDEGIGLLEGAARSPDAPAIVNNQLGELLVLAGRPDEAVPHFEQAVAGNDRLAQPCFNLAVLHEERGNTAEAIRLYEQAVARNPRHFQAQFNLGRLFGRTGEPARQEELFEAAIRSNPDFVRGYFYLAKLLMDQGEDLARAERLTRDGLARDADGAQAGPLGFFLLADILNRTARPREAAEALARARAIAGRTGSVGR